MILEKNIVVDSDGKKYVECYFDSSNITKTIYFEHMNKFYIFFKRGHGYSYVNVDKELYENFEKSESQGLFFNSKIKNKPEHECRYEFKLMSDEIAEVEKIITESKKNAIRKNIEQ